MPPAYYRGPHPSTWLAACLVGAVALAGLVSGVRAVLEHVRDAERQRVYTEIAQWPTTWPSERAQWARTRDSLAALAAQRDTVLRWRIHEVLTTLTDTVRDTVHDTIQLPASAVRACVALAHDCEAYRATTTQALALADTLRRTDSLRAVSLLLGLTATRDSLRRHEQQTARRPGWRAVAESGGAGLLVGAITCLVVCR